MSDAVATAAAIRDGSTSAREAVSAALQRIAELDDDINAFTVLLADEALTQADAVTQESGVARWWASRSR